MQSGQGKGARCTLPSFALLHESTSGTRLPMRGSCKSSDRRWAPSPACQRETRVTPRRVPIHSVLSSLVQAVTSPETVGESRKAAPVPTCLVHDVKSGQLTSFPQAVQLKEDEIVVFSWITYNSRAHRDEVNANVMKDPRMAGMDPKSLPFDGKRLIYGGFETLLAL